MTLFETLLMGHLAGDWLLQSEWQARNKYRSWRALLTHVVIYHLLIFAVLLLRIGPDVARVYVVILVLASTHALIDRRLSLILLMRKLRIAGDAPPEPWLILVVDQVIHILLLGLAAEYLSA